MIVQGMMLIDNLSAGGINATPKAEAGVTD